MAETDSTRADYQKAYQAANHEKIAAQKRRYAIENADAIRAKQAAWREANREKLKAYMAQRYVEKREEYRVNARKNYLEKSEAYKARSAKREAQFPELKKQYAAAYRKRHAAKLSEKGRREWRENLDKNRARKAKYRAENPALGAHYVRLRQTRKQQATPVWADLEAIKRVYKQCSKMSLDGGVKYHVDHIIPIRHKEVCGLHCEFNLQILTAAENQSKGNSFTTDWK